MGYAQESGYTPTDVSTIMTQFMGYINTQFNVTPAYTMETFIGTNLYKNFYAIAQLYAANEIKTSEIFQKLQDYFNVINARIARPSVTSPGIIEQIKKLGFLASVKPMIDADAGKISIAVDIDDGTHAKGTYTITSYGNLVTGTADKVTINGTQMTAQAGAATPGAAVFQAATSNDATAASLATQINAHATLGLVVKAKAIASIVHLTARHGGIVGNVTTTYTNGDANVGATVQQASLTGGVDNADYEDIRLDICQLLSVITVGGAVTQGTEQETITLSNGQAFVYKFFLPDRIQVWLRLTTTLSENNQVLVGSPDDVKLKLISNLDTRYQLGKNFEPQKYFNSVDDAPWTSQVLLEWTSDVTDGVVDVGATWHSTVYDAAFNELFDYALERILLVEN